ncbi:MAG: sugar phosphate isomerase/epimerase [Armatimonadetes bacterium]|nr:sugar phosphate isomerase/epimerase [Armatimonadota bacterium]
MRIGICASADKAQLIADAGADYIELSVRDMLVPEEGESTWATKRAEMLAMPLPVEAFNLFLPGDLKIVGDNADWERAARYVPVAFSRAAQVGASVIVFGSGGSRRVPEGYAREDATNNIADFLLLCASASAETGVALAIEPLNRAESNIINSVGEGAGYVTACNMPGVRLLADSYHMEKDNEPVSEATKHGALLVHAHTADTGRFAPATGTYDHAAFFTALRAGGYDGRVSIESTWRDLASEAAPAIAHLRRAAG